MWTTFDQFSQKIAQFNQQEGVKPCSGLGHLFWFVSQMSFINRVYLDIVCRLKHREYVSCFTMYRGLKKHFYHNNKTWDNIHAYFQTKTSAQRHDQVGR